MSIVSSKIISTHSAPSALGPYSQAISVKDFLFISGQLPIDPASNWLETKDITKAVKLCLENLRAIVETAGLTMNHVVKTTIFLTDLANFDAVNEVYSTYFHLNPPARSCVQVAALPKGAIIEIEAIAVK